jgi:hypothetical protein
MRPEEYNTSKLMKVMEKERILSLGRITEVL